jgi:hypothetical protein
MPWYHPVKRAAAAAALGGGIVAISLSAAAGPALASSTHQKRHAVLRPHHQRRATKTRAAATTAAGGESVVANYTSASILDTQFSAQLAPGATPDHATGTFTAQLALANNTVGTLAGPVTCLDVVGSKIGLFYPVTSSTPSALGALIKGVTVSVQLGAKGQPVSFSFQPSLTPTASSCAPLPGLVPVTSGAVTVGS